MRSPRLDQSYDRRGRVGWVQSCCPLTPSGCDIARTVSDRDCVRCDGEMGKLGRGEDCSADCRVRRGDGLVERSSDEMVFVVP